METKLSEKRESGQTSKTSVWSALCRFFKGRQLRRVHPIGVNSAPDTLVQVVKTTTKNELEVFQSEDCPKEQNQGGFECDHGPEVPELITQLECNSPNPKSEVTEASEMIADETNDCPTYYTADEIIPRCRSKKTEKKLQKIRASFIRAPRICMSPIVGEWDMDRIFLEETLAFNREQIAGAGNRSLVLVTPSRLKKTSWIKSMKMKFMEKVFPKKNDEKTEKLSEDEITEMIIDKFDEKLRRKSSKATMRREKSRTRTVLFWF